MKKIVFSFFFLLGIALQTVFAQSETKSTTSSYPKGSFDVNAGVGIGASYYTITTFNSSLIPISLSADYGVADKFSVGGYASYSSISGDLWKYSYTVLGVRGAYHFYNTDNIDLYAGGMLGYNMWSVSYTGSGLAPTSSGTGAAAWSGFAGGRYRFSKNFGVFAEVGYGTYLLQAGITIKLK